MLWLVGSGWAAVRRFTARVWLRESVAPQEAGAWLAREGAGEKTTGTTGGGMDRMDDDSKQKGALDGKQWVERCAFPSSPVAACYPLLSTALMIRGVNQVRRQAPRARAAARSAPDAPPTSLSRARVAALQDVHADGQARARIRQMKY